MGLSSGTYYVIECDRCGREAPWAEPEETIRDAEKAFGYSPEKGQYLCAHCREKECGACGGCGTCIRLAVERGVMDAKWAALKKGVK